MLVTSKLCADGFAPPWVAVNDMVVRDTASTGGAGFTVSATSTVLGEPVAPAAVTVTCVVYVPGASPVIDGVTAMLPGAVPLCGLTDSHGTDSLAVQSRLPPPVLVTAMFCAAGLAPPCVAVKDSVFGETDKAGWGGGPPQLTGAFMSACSCACVSARS